jgi:sRNA-binding regulator protein Hfq
LGPDVETNVQGIKEQELIDMTKRMVPGKVSAATQGNGSQVAVLDREDVANETREAVNTQTRPAVRKVRAAAPAVAVRRFSGPSADEHGANRQAELFYLQKQIQTQTQMIFILEDGSRVQGVIEWYDRQSIKVRGKSRVLIYKSAIKYLYKAGEMGTAPEL